MISVVNYMKVICQRMKSEAEIDIGEFIVSYLPTKAIISTVANHTKEHKEY
jgi:hypothetical protein